MNRRISVRSLFVLLIFTLGLSSSVTAQSEPQPSPTSVTNDQSSAVDSTIIATVNSGSRRLRVRSGPGTTYAIKTRLDNGQRVPVLARNREGSWLLVLAPPDTYGWISSDYVLLNVSLSQVPAAGIPVDAAPTPLPTTQAREQTPTAQAISTPAPSIPLPAGTLAVPVFDARQRTYSVWLVNADGTNLRKVVDEASTPALSIDGSMLAYRNWQRDDRGIVVARSDGADPLRITDKLEDVLPSFSPDGTKVALSSYRWGDRKNRLYYAWTDNQDQIAWEWGEGGIYGEDPFWMANGRILYRVTRRDTEAEELWSMSSVDGQDRQLLYSANSIRAPAAAFNSRWVTFMAADNGNWDIYIIDTSTSAVRRLTTHEANDGLPVWSPDGRYIAFVSDREGQWGIWTMHTDGTNQQLLTRLPGSVDGTVEFEMEYLTNGWLEEQIAWSR